jgi:hypothetical protein
MFVALGIQHAMCMHHIVICRLPGSTTFFHSISWTAQFKQKKFIEPNIRVLIFSTIFLWNLSHSKNKWVRYDQKYIFIFMLSSPYSCQILMKILFSRHIVDKYSTIKFHENPPSGSQVVPCRWTDRQMDGQKGRQTWWSL